MRRDRVAGFSTANVPGHWLFLRPVANKTGVTWNTEPSLRSDPPIITTVSDGAWDSPGDSPAWARAHNGGTVTSYLDGLVITGTTPAWTLANDHGDVVATVDLVSVAIGGHVDEGPMADPGPRRGRGRRHGPGGGLGRVGAPQAG